MSGPLKIGLTGSIGMGKSTTAKMFADLGVAVWDADAAVHRLYGRGGGAIDPVSRLCPDAVVEGAVDRLRLSVCIASNPSLLRDLEKVIHPLVAADRSRFTGATSARVILYDIPLLFETGADAEMDLTVVVSALAQVQRTRVLERPGMTVEKFDAILARQMPDVDKRGRADHVIDTNSLDAAEAGVQKVMDDVYDRLMNA